MKKRIGAILLTICMLVGLLPTAAFATDTCGGDPKLVFAYDATKHWIECEYDHLACMSNYYGDEVSTSDDITGDLLLSSGLLDLYFENVEPDRVSDYRMWHELYSGAGSAVEHCYNGGNTCILCQYDKTTGDSGDTGSGDSGDSGDTGSGDTGSGDTGSGDSGDTGDTGSGDSGEAETTDSPWVKFTPDSTYADQTPYYMDIAVSSWDELENAIATVPKDIESGYEPWLTISVKDFVWPEEASELTIKFDDSLEYVPKITLFSMDSTEGVEVVNWVIPEHITLNCYENMEISYSPDKTNIVVNGTVNAYALIGDPYPQVYNFEVNGALNLKSNQARVYASELTVHDGGSLTAARFCSFPDSVTVKAGGSMQIDGGTVINLTVETGATFSSTIGWTLIETLTLGDGVEITEGPMKISTSTAEHSGNINAAIVTEGSAVFSPTISIDASYARTGALTLQGDLAVGPITVDTNRNGTSESAWGHAKIIVPAESYVKAQYINEDIYGADSDLSINVAGTLEFAESGGTHTWKIGNLALGETAEDGTVTQEGTVIMKPYSHLFADYKNTETTVSSKITGHGTIKMYATLNSDGGWGPYPGLFGNNYSPDDMVPLYEGGYIANTVTIWRNWECAHAWDEGSVTTGATCTENGVKTYTCTLCGVTKTEVITATGHTEVTDPAVAATCTTAGKTEGKHCSVCEEVLIAQETVPALGHIWSTNDCTEAATCNREGCGETRPARTHVWGGWTVTKKATCTEDGSQTRTCESCGTTDTETIPATGHDWGQWVVDKEATDSEDGSQYRICNTCSEKDTQTIPMLAKQDVRFPASSYSGAYGGADMYNTAKNLTTDGGSLTYSSADTSVATVDKTSGKVTIMGAGTTTITAAAEAVPGKYVETTASYTLTINKAALTVTANDKTIAYGEAASNDGFTATGFVKNEDSTVLSGAAVYSYDYRQYSAVGEYAITVSGLTSDNYEITLKPGKLTVTKTTDYTLSVDKLEQLTGKVTDVTILVEPYDTSAQIKVEYLVDDSWTTEVPQAVGEYSVRAALTGSENINAVSDKYFTDTLVVKAGVTVNTGSGAADVDVAVEVTESTDSSSAKITVTEENLNQIVSNANGDVSIDLGGVSGVDELVMPGNLVQELSKADSAESLTIATEDASVTLSSQVMDTVSSAVKSGDDQIAVRLESVAKEDLNQAQQEALAAIPEDAQIVDVSLVITHTDGSESVLHELGGDVTITVPYDELPGVVDGQYVVACYVSDDGTVTYLFAECDVEKRTITFTTDHFSNYAVFVSNDPAVVVEDGSGSGLYAVGATVTIKANSKSGYTFAGWEIVSGSVKLANAKAAETTFTMPSGSVEVKATYTKNSSGGSGWIAPSTGTPAAPQWENPFKDVSADAYYFEAVKWAVGEGITNGTGAATFSPDASCTRAQAVTFLWRAAGSPVVNYAMSFTDVPADAFYAEAVRWALSEGITNGTGATTFSPDAACTRAQIVTFLHRAEKSPAAETVNPFADVSLDSYYGEAVMWAVANGVTNGTGAAAFSPDADCTRAQIVTFLWRCMK